MRHVLAAAAALFSMTTAASAATVTLAEAPPGINQSAVAGCIFGDNSLGCDAAYLLPAGSPGASVTNLTHTFTVGAIRALVGNTFSVGVDANISAGRPEIQQVTKFSLCLGSSACPNSGNLYDLAQVYDINASVNQGNGFTDYLISLFNLGGLADNQLVTFTISLTGLTDGAEQFFFLDAPEVVPLPAAAWMMLAGIGGLAAARGRKKPV